MKVEEPKIACPVCMRDTLTVTAASAFHYFVYAEVCYVFTGLPTGGAGNPHGSSKNTGHGGADRQAACVAGYTPTSGRRSASRKGPRNSWSRRGGS